MKPPDTVRFVGVFFLLLAVVFVPSVANASSPIFTKSSNSVYSCSTIPADSGRPAMLRCGVKAVADGFVAKLEPTSILGNHLCLTTSANCIYRVLIVQETPSTPQQIDEAYVKFDLRDLPPFMRSSRAQPRNASLWLFASFLNTFQDATVEVHRVVTNDWNQSTLTWNTKPPFSPDFVSEHVNLTNAWQRWDVTVATQIALSDSPEASFALVPAGVSPRNYVWFHSTDYNYFAPPPQNLNITTAPELDVDFVEPLVEIVTPFPGMAVGVDQTILQTDPNGKIQTYLEWGPHQLIVPEAVPIDSTTRNGFYAWSDGVQQANRTIIVDNNLTITAEYRKQYKLEVASPYSLATGAGWYFEGTTAAISVSETNLPAEGIAGYLGGRHIFDRWSGACTSTEPQCSIVIDAPKSAVAQWRDDFTVPLIAAAFVSIGVVLTVFLRRRRKR